MINFCPKCGKPFTYSIEYGYGEHERYDGVSERVCEPCNIRVGRWSGKILEDSGDEKVLDMPEKYLKEMLCDWWGASVATGNGGNSKDWYEKVKKKTKMHPHTRHYFERAIQNSDVPYLLP